MSCKLGGVSHVLMGGMFRLKLHGSIENRSLTGALSTAENAVGGERYLSFSRGKLVLPRPQGNLKAPYYSLALIPFLFLSLLYISASVSPSSSFAVEALPTFPPGFLFFLGTSQGTGCSI